MKHINWNSEKSRQLKAVRGIGFEEVVFLIEQNLIIDDIVHPDRAKYPNQRIYVLEIQEYIYLVPYVESKEGIFLKTIIPSRKATRDYLKRGNNNGTR